MRLPEHPKRRAILRCQASSTFPDTQVRDADTKRVPSGPFHELPDPVSPWSVQELTFKTTRGIAYWTTGHSTPFSEGFKEVREQLPRGVSALPF
jgi:hypothetical protein